MRISVFDSSNNLIITKKTPVDTYGKFSYTVVLNEKFSDGKYIVKSQYGNSKSTVNTSSFMITAGNNSSMTSNVSEIPVWIKNNAGWWADGSIDDASFVQGIQFLVQEGFMKIPMTQQGSGNWLATKSPYGLRTMQAGGLTVPLMTLHLYKEFSS